MNKLFCEKCGTELQDLKCPNINPVCGYIKFYNPTPVAVCLIPVKTQSGIKILGVKRGIEPKKGELALPGGFQEIEDVIDCALRELKEETNTDMLAISGLPKEQIFEEDCLVYTTPNPAPDRTRNLMFFISKVVLNESDIDFNFKTPETEEVLLLDQNSAIAFPLHKKAIDWFYKKSK